MFKYTTIPKVSPTDRKHGTPYSGKPSFHPPEVVLLHEIAESKKEAKHP